MSCPPIDPIFNPDNIPDIVNQRVARRNGRALVLTGGGALGAFQVGALKKLYETGYRPDLICGISVGAINAVKLAEGDDAKLNAAEKLENLWNQLATGNLHILSDWAGAEALKQKFQGLLTAHGAGLTATASLFPPADVIGVGTWLSQLPGIAISSAIAEASRVHALHSVGGGAPDEFQGLIDLIRSQIRHDLITTSGISLRIGMVDMESGSLWMATEPSAVSVREPDGALLQVYRSRLEREPDLSRHRNDPDRTRYIDLPWATYASSVMPVYFPPVEAIEVPAPELNGFDIRCNISQDFFSVLRQENPQALQERNIWKHFFDGGLADIMPIRTAMRLGYREITVIGTSPLQKIDWAYRSPDPNDGTTTPLLQYLSGFINCWSTNVARSDLSQALAYNEFLGWLYRFNLTLSPEQSRVIQQEFETYWRERRPHWENVLGATTWLGGSVPINPSDTNFVFGRPFSDEGCQIRVVAPEEPLLLDVLGFTDRENLNRTMEIGYQRMNRIVIDNFRPSQLSFPVQDDQRMTRAQANERGLSRV